MADTRVKICGITNHADACAAVAAGADALGFVFYEQSPRYVAPEQVARIVEALPPFVTTVGLFVNSPVARIREIMTLTRLNLVQLHGDESAQDCIIAPFRVMKALRVRDAASLQGAEDYPVAALLLDAWSDDAYGGTGHSFDWELVRQLGSRQPLVLAGGLNPANVATAIQTVRPYAVDVSSGVEESPGRKDVQKINEFIQQVRKA